MDKLQTYLNGLSPAAQAEFARRCDTSLGYLRKAISTGQRLGEGLCLRIGVESAGTVQPGDLRPDVDWQRLLSCPARVVTEPAAAGV